MHDTGSHISSSDTWSHDSHVSPASHPAHGPAAGTVHPAWGPDDPAWYYANTTRRGAGSPAAVLVAMLVTIILPMIIVFVAHGII